MEQKTIKQVNNEEYYVIKGLKMMMYLVRHGFDVLKVDNNEIESKFKVFLFRDSYELRKCMETYPNHRR